jgi:lysozyme family protein
MKETYGKALAAVLKYEGGKDDDPRDPGGRTNQGVIQRVYSAWRIRKGLQPRDVFLMTDDERDAIYYQNYAVKVRFDELPPGVDMVVFDGGVNSGPSQSIKWVQRALGLNADGVLGDVTMQRIQDHPNHDALIADVIKRRRTFLRALKPYKTFGKGWEARIANLQKVGQAWAMGTVGPEVVFIPNGNKKATLVDAKPLPVKAPADITASGGFVSTTLSTAQGLFEPLQGNPFIDKVLLGIVVAGGVMTAVGLAWGWYARRKEAELQDALDTAPASATGPADNDNVPLEVLRQYADPAGRGVETGNIAEGVTTQSGRVAGDTETKKAA